MMHIYNLKPTAPLLHNPRFDWNYNIDLNSDFKPPDIVINNFNNEFEPDDSVINFLFNYSKSIEVLKTTIIESSIMSKN